MFNAEDLLEIALRLEHNGEQIYRKAERQTTNAVLKALLERIAKEEKNHADWLTDLKIRLQPSEDSHLIAELSRALAQDVVKDQAFSLQEVDFSQIDALHQMIRVFIGYEEDAIALYEVLRSFITDPAAATALETIIAEERRHIHAFRQWLSDH